MKAMMQSRRLQESLQRAVLRVLVNADAHAAGETSLQLCVLPLEATAVGPCGPMRVIKVRSGSS